MRMAAAKRTIPTVSQMSSDRLTEIAARYWAQSTEKHDAFDTKIVAEIYQRELLRTNFNVRRVMFLEFSQYLEEYLWPNYDPASSPLEHVLSIIVMVNEKFRERVPAWEIFTEAPSKFPGFFKRVLEAALDCNEMSFAERIQVIHFLNRCFNSVEVDIIRTEIQKLVALPIWTSLLPGRRDELFRASQKLKKFWNLVQKHDAKLNDQERIMVEYERKFLLRLIEAFLSVVENVPEEDDLDPLCVRYCECVLQLLIDLEALLPTRRFFNVLLDSCHVVTRCSLSPLISRKEGRLFSQLLDMLKFYARFEINDLSGEPLTENEMTAIHYNRITSLQKAAFRNFKEELKDFYLLNVASVDTSAALRKYFSRLTKPQLYSIAESLHLLPPFKEDEPSLEKFTEMFLLELLVTRHERRQNQLDYINELPLYPTEDIIWDENLVPSEYFSGEGHLALNKLNLQFLTLYDYLLRNFNLFRLESTYEIRQDVEDAVFRMKPWKHETESTVVFGGWARMALPTTNFNIVEVAKPHIGERSPAVVRADVTVNLTSRHDIRREWESLRKHDVCFLVTVRPQAPVGTRYDIRRPFQDQIQIAYVRGCEIEGMLGPDGRLIEEFSSEPKPNIPGSARTYRVWLDCCQYRLDMERNVKGDEDVYETFNILIRRKPKENNFKAVLETIRHLMNTKFVVPDWLHDILLGYGDPGAAHYTKMPNALETLDFFDTFLDYDHVKESFHDYKFVSEVDETKLVPPFRLTFSDVEGKKRQRDDGKESAEQRTENQKEIIVETVVVPSYGPYPYLQPKCNTVRFTPVQVEAVRSGMQPGLTMVVGPPGTGKTDVAVQIISNIYHNWPEQRTLIITHSNQALNQLFEKIMHLDVDERHLLRMGHGEEALETEKDFSRYGRVNYILAKRLELLGEVDRLQHSLNVTGDVAYTCETANNFFVYQVRARWEAYQRKIQSSNRQAEDVAQLFPFTMFFANAPQPLFKGQSFEEDYEISESCWRYVSRMFQQLDEFRAFELLRTGRDRADYLLVKEAKIIAMTCTHAALRRHDLVQLGFRYDNVLMEEAAQILEIETFIPLLLQEPKDGRNRLKRWIMIGDHHQLPPVIKNMAFQKYCNMEQSLFARFVALGVPTVDLDMQGRARPTLASLYNWRYKRVGNLDHVNRMPEFQSANAGFAFEYQLIDVGDYNGVGESAPSPHFYQNLAEAEYAVALFMYMRILGYPAERISILTTYNGQKHLIRDVIEQRCSKNPLFGRPHKVTTVDKYQGQQNDYIILSLVRTSTVGHLRDVRRLVVALSRSRLGLYIVGRVALFRNCFELTPAFNLLRQRSQKLLLLPQETWPTQRKVTDTGSESDRLQIEDMPHMVQFVCAFYQANADALKNAWRSQTDVEGEISEEPYKEGKVDTEHSVDIEKAQKDEGGRIEKDIEFEIIDDQATAKDAV